MNILLSKSRLNTIRLNLYGRNVEAVFYKVTPTAGPVEIGRIRDGFLPIRERRAGQEIDGSGVKFWLSADAGIDSDLLRYNAEVALTINGQTTRYGVAELLPMQQLGEGYVLRLKPLQGATG